MIGALHGPWLLGPALLLVAAAARWGPRPRAGEASLLAALTVGAAAVRLIGGLWGPLHVNGQGPLWVRGAFDPAALAGYGPGYFELFGWWVRDVGVAPDRAIFAANALLSALTPALLYIAARLSGVARGGALAAAVVMAADAVTVRTAASEGYFSSMIALVTATMAALALAVRQDVRRDRPAARLALGAACLLASAAARIHPMAYVPLALTPLVVLGATQPDAWRVRALRAAAAAAAIGITVLITSGNAILTALRTSHMTGDAFSGIVRQDGVLLLGLLALTWGLSRWVKPPWLPLLGIASLLFLLATHNSFQEHPLQKLGYQRLFFPGMLLGAAPLLPRPMQRTAWALLAAALVAVILLRPARAHLDRPTTEQLEYRFLQETLRNMPPGCTLAAVSRAGDRIWEIPSYLAPGDSAQRSVGQPSDVEAAPGSCLLYVRASLCTSAEARALCEAVERDTRLARAASQTFPAAPSFAGLPYDRSEVEVVLFRVVGHRAGVGDGDAISPAFAQALYERMTSRRAPDDCRVVRFDTSRFRITVGLQTASGIEHTFELAAARGNASRRAGRWALAVAPEVERDCGATLAAVERVLKDIGAPAAIRGMEPTG